MLPRRSVCGLIMTCIYLLIVGSPLAMSLLPARDGLAHAAVADCCCACCCSSERKANKTCCCCKKHQTADKDKHDDKASECCAKKRFGKAKTNLTSNCRCGKNKQIALWGGNESKLLPFRFVANIPPFSSAPHGRRLPQQVVSRCDEPPDPPPEIVLS